MVDDRANRKAARRAATRQLDAVSERFETAWQTGQRPRIEEFLSSQTLQKKPARLKKLLVRLIQIDLDHRWRSPSVDTLSSREASESTGGSHLPPLPSRPKLEDYCRQFKELGPVEELPGALIAAEYVARHRWGDKPPHEEYLERFPAKAEGLPELLARADAALKAEETDSAAPDSGEQITLTPAEFEKKYGWKNDPGKVPALTAAE